MYVKTGATNIPDDTIIKLMILDLREILGKWKILQVEHAFELGMQEKLPVDMNLYNKPISIVFLTRLMVAYQRFIAPAIEKERKALPGKVVTEEEKKAIMKKAVTASFQSYKKNKSILNFGNSIFEALSDKINVDDADVRLQAERLFRSELDELRRKTSFKDMLNQAIKRIDRENYNEEDEKAITRIMYDLKLKKFFDELVEMDMDVMDLI